MTRDNLPHNRQITEADVVLWRSLARLAGSPALLLGIDRLWAEVSLGRALIEAQRKELRFHYEAAETAERVAAE